MTPYRHHFCFSNIFQTLSQHFMKNKFYTSLLIWIGLTLATVPSLAKVAQPTAKKQVSSPAKSVKTNVHNVKQPPAAKKTAANTLAKQKPNQAKSHQITDTKDNKHDKSKSRQLADAKDSKHGKSKSQQLADAKDSKHGKSKSQQRADAKDSKHGKSKSQQRADAKDSKHGKSKSQQLAYTKHGKHSKTNSHQNEEESYGEENDGDASTAVENDEQIQATDEHHNVDLAIEQANSNDTIYSESKAKENSPLITTPEKSTPLFFQATAPSIAMNTKPSDRMPSPQPIDSHNENPFAALAQTNNPMTQETANNERVHSLITHGSKPSETVDNSDEEETPSESDPSETNNLLIKPNNQRVHSSIASRNSNNFIDNATNSETNRQVASAHGIIDSSLSSAGEKAGLSNDMVIELTDIFAWDIDFANNLQEGDQFTVLYEQGASNKAHNQIIAAQFINRGKTYTAIRYKDKEGIISYYTPDGRSLRKAFLSTPLDYVKISSHFDPHRRHPILNRIRAHKGVDYAARTGTPVKAAGDGVITFHGNQGGYGRMIVIAHGEHYETAYAHLSNFRKDLQDGEPVKQGEVIGYVGQSGLATGPHLHYEFRVDGVHRDPEKLDSKQAMRLPNGIWEDFHAQTVPVLTQLNQAKASTLVAKNP
jgi:murein DD-endopeptidase MepM/ murein hydrolase activator NlpD